MKKSYKKMLASTAAIALVASAVAPVASAASFKDLNGHMYENEILALVDAGIINGYPDGTFLPNNSLTRSDVVKLLGKYLVSLGHEVPSDYKTKMRFTDLTAQSQDELLQYAALVKDVGVFQGSAGQLMHRDEMRRDQMATVLVRAFNVINDFDYVAHVKEQGFTSTISDLNRTTVEHQTNIAVLDYYDMVKGASFNPKDMTKRGQFAYFLYHMLNVETKPVLTVKKIEVQAADKLSVTLSDDKAYTVTLSKPLVENVETDVTFTIDKVEYSAKVKYEVPDLKVTAVSNPNSAQIKIDFNQPVALANVLNEADVNKIVKVAGIATPGKVDLLKGELSADKKSLTVTIKGLKPLAEGRYNVVVEGVKTEKGLTLIKYDEVPTFVADKAAPDIASVENASATRIKVKFTEPVVNTSGTTQFTLPNGSIISNVTGVLERNATEVTYDFTNASVNGVALSPGTTVNITFGALVDISNNVAPANTIKTSATIGVRDGVAPTLLNIEQVGARKFKLIFSEEIRDLTRSDITVTQNSQTLGVINVEKDKNEPKAYVIETAQELNGYATVANASGRYITDLSGEVNTFYMYFNFVRDTTVPNYVSTKVVKENNEEYLEVLFDRNINLAPNPNIAFTGWYSQSNGQQGQLNVSAIPQKVAANDKALRVKLRDLLGVGTDFAGAKYVGQLHLTGVISEYGYAVATAPQQINFDRLGDLGSVTGRVIVERVESVPTTEGSRYQNIRVTYSHAVDFASAADFTNYFVEGAQVVSALPTQGGLANRQIDLRVTVNDTAQLDQFLTNVTINNVYATGRNVLVDPYYNVPLVLRENIKPYVTDGINVSINPQKVGERISLTFSEPVRTTSTLPFSVKIGNTDIATGVNYSSDNRVLNIVLSRTIQQGEVVTVELNPNVTITDAADNVLDFRKTVFSFDGNTQRYTYGQQ
ncbi:S-layer homology domain-containing protein [Metasolibacillus fluoroglycofenilyticus]|uniref:S-layer homology domain-containing protein n=1 Tax=Metasolibacillus fluoroglycofenilyticus TaxID=1239396 RepID=UPI000D3953FA|nr:S-layer homology domain-containing protein [Metasolibacillus fluoroglycofenilyticus]